GRGCTDTRSRLVKSVRAPASGGGVRMRVCTFPLSDAERQLMASNFRSITRHRPSLGARRTSHDLPHSEPHEKETNTTAPSSTYAGALTRATPLKPGNDRPNCSHPSFGSSRRPSNARCTTSSVTSRTEGRFRSGTLNDVSVFRSRGSPRGSPRHRHG